MIKVPFFPRDIQKRSFENEPKSTSRISHAKAIIIIHSRQHNRKNNRSRLDLINDILGVSQYPSSYWNIICLVSTSSAEKKKLVSLLLSRGLLEASERWPNRYRTTKKGFIYLQKYKEMKGMLEWKENTDYQFPKKYRCSLFTNKFDKKG